VLGEVSRDDRVQALKTHRDFLKRSQVGDESAIRAQELVRVEQMLEQMAWVEKNPRGRLVEVTKSRAVEVGAVGRAVYADFNRNHCRVEFGNGERVSCALSSVVVIDWEPLPHWVPCVGERVVDFRTGQDLVVVEWMSNEVRVQPPGINEDTFRIDREYVRRSESALFSGS
jgi:hypothetical protein